MFKYFLIIIFFLLSPIQSSYAEILYKYEVIGNDRVSKQTIINFTDSDINQDLLNKDLDSILKKLYETTFFEDVSLNLTDGVLKITVKEYPIIQQIIINGIKAENQVDTLKKAILLKEKNPYNKTFVKQDLQKMLTIMKTSGFYFANIKVSEQVNDNNTVNIIYDIERGDKAVIKKIKFIGDKKFKDRKLHSVITTEESKFWKFISRGKYLDEARIELDKRLLKNFYLNKGYYQVNVENAYTQILDKTNFSLVFKIDAGKKFVFNDLNFIIPDDFDKEKFKDVTKVFKELKNSTYSYRKIEKILDEIDIISMQENYEFIDAKVKETVVDDDKIDFTFFIKESEKFFVERINIFGNNVTQEEFIRNQLIVDEGDPFNVLLHNKSLNKLKSKNIFGSTEYKIRDGSENGLKIIDIIVTEKPTGEISAGAGYGTTGATTSFGIKENNFNGKGINLNTNLSLTEESIRGLFAYTHPNFAYTDRALTTSVESTVTDKEKDYGYKSTLNSISLGTGYEQYKDLYFYPSISISGESLTTTATASADYKKQEGSYFDTLFNYSITYDKRNSSYQPTDGFKSTWIQKLPLLSDNANILNGYEITTYKEIIDDMVISAGFYSRAVNSLGNKDVRVSKRLFIPKSKLHGFEPGKVGPKDGSDYVGGNYVTTFNTSTTVPYLLQTLENIDLKVFFDAANIWGVDYSSSIDDSNEIRSAFGAAVEVLTPVGPLSFSLSQPITKASGDKTETFRFQLGTTF
tara:strand:+ start:1708 stop:3948 length:2241 start_codon:yes stop_codon:yes gene_type:complete